MTRHEQLNELIHQHGFRESTVSTWSEDRIATVLSARRRDGRLAVQRAANTAACIDGTSRGQPSRVERQEAAAYLEETLDRGGDELVNAVLYVGHCLSDSEAKDLAAKLSDLFRGVA
jgi:hypothetical protein